MPPKKPKKKTPAKNFEYIITGTSITVQELDVNGTIVPDPGASGKLRADVTGGVIYTEVKAASQSPTGSGALQLKYIPAKKNVFTAAQPFDFSNGAIGGLFLDDITLPNAD